MSKTSVFLAATVVFSVYSSCLGQNGVNDTVRREAVDAWHLAATEPTEFTMRISHTRSANGSTTLETEEYARSRHGKLVIYEETEKSLCFIKNEQGMFVLEKRGNGENWRLTEAIELEGGTIDELTTSSHSFVLAPSIQLYPGYTLDDAAKQDSIKWSKWKEFDEAGERVASFEMVVPEKIVDKDNGVIISPTRWEISVLVDHNYGIRHARKFSHTTGELIVEITNEYSDMLPKSIPAERTRNCLYNNTQSEFVTKHASFAPVPVERFELGSYGIGEVAFARKNGAVKLYVSCIAIGLTLLGIYYWTKVSRR